MTNMVDKQAKSVEFYTPERILERVRAYFGGQIDLDPATAPHNPTKARLFFTASNCGLFRAWADLSKNAFANPPYGKQIREWVAKIGKEASRGLPIVALLPGQRFEQAYWQQSLFNPSLTALVAVRSRVSFIAADGKPAKGNPYGSFLYCFNGTYERAVEAFAPIGMVLEIGRVTQHTERKIA